MTGINGNLVRRKKLWAVKQKGEENNNGQKKKEKRREKVKLLGWISFALIKALVL